MSRKWFSILALFATAIVLISSSSCGYNQHLESITVSPPNSTITLGAIGQDLPTQFTAFGTYIHPPQTKDITTTAIWSTNTPSLIYMDPKTPGLVHTTGNGCGTNLGVTATVYSDPNDPPSGTVVAGSAVINVSFGNGITCP